MCVNHRFSLQLSVGPFKLSLVIIQTSSRSPQLKSMRITFFFSPIALFHILPKRFFIFHLNQFRHCIVCLYLSMFSSGYSTMLSTISFQKLRILPLNSLLELYWVTLFSVSQKTYSKTSACSLKSIVITLSSPHKWHKWSNTCFVFQISLYL